MNTDELIAIAMDLPVAQAKDLVQVRLPQTGVPSRFLKIVSDSALRQRLISSRIAEPLQTPRGRQKIAAIVRIYPDRDAPKVPAKAATPTLERPIARDAATIAPSAGRSSLPTIEAMGALIERLQTEESRFREKLLVTSQQRVANLKSQLSNCDDSDLEDLHRELGIALDEQKALAAHARAEAWRAVEGDQSFPERLHLRVLAHP